jgi:hypothetical protein
MEYTCTLTRGKRKERWTCEIRLLKDESDYYEVEIIGRGTYFHVIVGRHLFGNFVCIPNHDVGSELSHYSDLFWNTERLSDRLKKVDATTVATGLSHLKELTGFTPDS